MIGLLFRALPLQLLYHSMDGLAAQVQAGGRGLLLQVDHRSGFRLQSLYCSRGHSFLLCRSQHGPGDPGHHPIDSGEALQGPHVERSDLCPHRCGRLLIPRCIAQVPDIWEQHRR